MGCHYRVAACDSALSCVEWREQDARQEWIAILDFCNAVPSLACALEAHDRLTVGRLYNGDGRGHYARLLTAIVRRVHAPAGMDDA